MAGIVPVVAVTDGHNAGGVDGGKHDVSAMPGQKKALEAGLQGVPSADLAASQALPWDSTS